MKPVYFTIGGLVMLLIIWLSLAKCEGNRSIEPDKAQVELILLKATIKQLEAKAEAERKAVSAIAEERNAYHMQAEMYRSKYERARQTGAGRQIVVREIHDTTNTFVDTTTLTDYCAPLLADADSVIGSQQRELNEAVKELVLYARHDSTTREIIAAYKREGQLNEQQLTDLRKLMKKQQRAGKWQTAGFTIAGAGVGFGAGFLTGKFMK